MKKLIALCGLVLGTFLGAAPSSAVPVLSFTANNTHININETVTIEATISGLGAEILSGYDLNFTYNAAVLNLQSPPLQDLSQLKITFDPFVLNDAPLEGNQGFFAVSSEDDADLAGVPQLDSFLLFRFTMEGMADGVTFFTLGPQAGPFDFDRNFVSFNAESMDVDVGAICIAVGTGVCVQNPIPEPETYALMLAGLGVIGAVVCRRRPRAV